MSTIVERQTDAAVHVFESLKDGAKLARHFVDVIEQISGSVHFRERRTFGRVLLVLYRSL
jgi:hypothetical protein